MSWCLSIYTAVFVATDSQHVVQNVHELRHLAEDEDLAVFSDKFGNQMIEYLELHGGIYDVITIQKRRSRLNILEKVRMIAHFLELHEHVQQLDAVFAVVIVDCGDVAGDDLLVKLLLQLRQTN